MKNKLYNFINSKEGAGVALAMTFIFASVNGRYWIKELKKSKKFKDIK